MGRILPCRILTWVAVVVGLAAGASARAQDGDAPALEAEIERARAEEAAEAAALQEGAAAAMRGVELVEPPPGASPTWRDDLEQTRLEGHFVGEAWSAAWEELAADRAFREAGCFASTADLAALDGDLIRYRALAREDFRARRKSSEARLAVAMRDAVTEAHVATSLVCVGRLRAEEVTRGRFAVWFEDLEYVALLDRDGSWWNPKAKTNPEWIMRHEQLHFAITELAARRANTERGRHEMATKVVAGSPGEAMRGFAARWTAHFGAIVEEWQALQDRYDRETRHGTVPKQQTDWFARVHREMATLATAAR